MKKGFVRGVTSRSIWNSYLHWEDEGHKAGLFKDKALKLHTHHHELGGFPLIKAYMCHRCKKIIMETYIEEDK